MAQTNYTPIQLYYSTTAAAVPVNTNLLNGELAINITDGKLYYKDNSGTVQVIATKGAGTIGGSTTQIQYNNAGALAGSSAMVFNNSTNVVTLTTLNLTNALGAVYGGTGQSTYTTGDLLYSSASNTLSKLALGTANYILAVNSAGTNVEWAAPSAISVNTATNLAGGVAGSVPYQSGASTTTFLGIGAADRVMTSSGSAPQWVTALTGLTGVSSSSITNTSLTSTRVVYSGASGVQTNSANLTFDGTTLTTAGLSNSGTSALVKLVTVGGTSFSGTTVFAPATPAKLYMGTGTVTDATSAIGATNAVGAVASLAITPIAATNTSVTYTDAATLYIAGAPSAGTNITITNPYALYVAAGASYLGGNTAVTGTLSATGVATFSAGTAALPAITTSGDTNTGIFFPAADTIAFTEGGAEAARIDSSGNLLVSKTATGDGTSGFQTGAGRTSLTRDGATVLFTTRLTSDGEIVGLYKDNTQVGAIGSLSGGMYLGSGSSGTNRVTIDSSGNVGIGTSSPASLLDVSGAPAGALSRFLNTTAPTLSNDTHAGEAVFLRSGGTAGSGNVQAVLAFGKADGSSLRSGSAIASIQTTADTDQIGLGFYVSTSAASSQTMSQAAIIDSSGNLGVGTTSPAYKLDVTGPGTAGGSTLRLNDVASGANSKHLLLQRSSSTATIGIAGALTSDPLWLSRSGGYDVLIDSSGNLGVGTTSITSRFKVTSSSAESVIARLTSTGSTGCYVGFAGSGAVTEYDVACGSAASNVFAINTSATERARIDSSGRQLVGYTSATGSNKLQVTTTTTAYAEGGLSLVTGNGANAVGSNGPRADINVLLSENWKTNLLFKVNTSDSDTAPVEVGRFDKSGNLLVGATSANATEKFRVATSSTEVAFFANDSNTSGYSGIRSQIGSGGNNTSTWHFRGETRGVANWYLYGNGTTSYSSDSRLKKNIETTRDGYLNDLMQLRVVKYNWINSQDTTPKELGLIAQEVEQVFPNLVQEHDIEGVDGQRKHIKHSVMEFILIKAIQEQQALITTLTARITALEGA